MNSMSQNTEDLLTWMETKYLGHMDCLGRDMELYLKEQSHYDLQDAIFAARLLALDVQSDQITNEWTKRRAADAAFVSSAATEIKSALVTLRPICRAIWIRRVKNASHGAQ